MVADTMTKDRLDDLRITFTERELAYNENVD